MTVIIFFSFGISEFKKCQSGNPDDEEQEVLQSAKSLQLEFSGFKSFLTTRTNERLYAGSYSRVASYFVSANLICAGILSPSSSLSAKVYKTAQSLQRFAII